MPRHVAHSSDDEEPLEDKTVALQLHSKRTERQKKQKAKRDRRRDAIINLTKLPTEMILECLKYSQPGDVLNFSHVNRRFRSLVDANANIIGDAIIRQRYTLLAQCLVLPKLLAEIEAPVRPFLVDEKRQLLLGIHHKPYQHVQSPDQHLVCTCLSCILAWNNLGVVLDFAHWQDNLDTGEPLPIIARGQTPEWNQKLVQRNACIMRTALRNSLWHARILEIHLASTVRAIRRQAKNKGNKRTHVDMTEEDARLGTDAFLSKPGPPSLEFPYHRDEYHMLYWKKSEERWLYGTAIHHERDLGLVLHLTGRRFLDPSWAK
ncbi:hypothetical protein N0V90_003191 [Kalmusia sp. IMI 367209]|nr:hypothetical protein N0V90_003191 [Kalmusia sp. IMI 367209]